VGTGGGGGGGAGNGGSGGAWSKPAHAFCMETTALAIRSTLAPSDSSVRGWAEAVDVSDNSDDAAGSGEVVTGMEQLGGAVVIIPGNTDTRLIGLGSLPEPLRRLYGCETAGRGRGRREGAVAANAASGRGEAASYSTRCATVPRGYCLCESGRGPAARVSPG
jgi:hypothetical protein